MVAEANGATFEIMWPGNEKCGSSTVLQSMIWNCRCTLRAWVKGYEGETVKSSPPGMEGLSFEEWQGTKTAGAADERDKQSLVEARVTKPMPHGFSAFPQDDILAEWAEYIPPKKGFFDVAMHGTPAAFCFGSTTANMSPRTLASMIRKNPEYTPGEKIRLLCCNTGKKTDGNYCFAEEPANILGVRVDSPNGMLYINRDGSFYIGHVGNKELTTFLPNERRRRK